MDRWMRARAFTSGLLTGLFLCLGLLAGFGYVLTERGFTAQVDVDEVSSRVRGEIEMQVAEMLPGVIGALKAEVPRRVAEELAGRLADAAFVVYGVKIHLPEDTLAEVRVQVEQIVTEQVHASLDAVDIAGSAAAWGERGQRMLAEALRRELRGRRLLLRLHPDLTWPSVPVVLSVP